jgi:hypothetical protein
VRRYGDLPRSVAKLASMCAKPNRAQDITPDGKFQWRGDQPIVAFGKHGGECFSLGRVRIMIVVDSSPRHMNSHIVYDRMPVYVLFVAAKLQR